MFQVFKMFILRLYVLDMVSFLLLQFSVWASDCLWVYAVPQLCCLQWEHMQAVDAQTFKPVTYYFIIRAGSTFTLW